jgi:hypothetical protein
MNSNGRTGIGSEIALRILLRWIGTVALSRRHACLPYQAMNETHRWLALRTPAAPIVGYRDRSSPLYSPGRLLRVLSLDIHRHRRVLRYPPGLGCLRGHPVGDRRGRGPSPLVAAGRGSDGHAFGTPSCSSPIASPTGTGRRDPRAIEP